MKHARAADALPIAVLPLAPRRGLSCEEAAAYIGLSATKFLALVGEGRMPKPVRVDRRSIWDIRELDAAFDALREDKLPELPIDDGWGDAAP